MENVQAVANNHDGITGTMTRVVEQDLFKMIKVELESVQKNLFEVFHKKNLEQGFNTSNFQFCGSNSTYHQCRPLHFSLDNNQDIFVNVYNPGLTGKYNLRVKVLRMHYQVYTLHGQKLDTDVICLDDSFDNCDLYFVAEL
jgi:hypothetical protein